MSRYLILVLINIPLIIAGILNAVSAYKLKLIQKRRLVLRIIFWLVILLGLIFAEPIYIFLFSNNLTKTEPLSLFDVIQISGIIFVFYIANLAYSKSELLERRFQELHKELSIRLSDESTPTKRRK